jgi:hypothetical protein
VTDRRRRFSNWLQTAAFVAAAVAVMATPPPHRVRNYPAWEFDRPQNKQLYGIEARLWVSKSAKSGLGITLRLKNPKEQISEFDLVLAQLSIGELTIDAKQAAKKITLKPHSSYHLYLPFLFDNQKLWNKNIRQAILYLRFNQGMKRTHWRADMNHVLHSFYRDIGIDESSSFKEVGYKK